MNDKLEFNIILEQLSINAISQGAKNKILQLQPFLNETECVKNIEETTQAKQIIEQIGSPPLAAMENINKLFVLAQAEYLLSPAQLTEVSQFIISCKRMKSYMKKSESSGAELSYYGASLYDLDDLRDELERCIRNGIVDDRASTELRDLRRKIDNCNISIKSKLETILKSKKECFSDSFVTTRSGRFVLPVKKEYKNQINGTVIETSGTGGTYFIEPTQVRKLVDELNLYTIDEENEVRKILYNLTSMILDRLNEFQINIDCMETLDFIFAKAKYSLQIKATKVKLNTNRKIKIIQGRHPLLVEKNCVPLDFEIGGDIRGIVITGPNTGGKTVALKTVGLLSLMAQSGLHVPVLAESEFCMNVNVLCDIGDGQSISENLSTFSSHITNIISVLENTTNESLVLLDELGSGTDPTEGMGLAISIIEELKTKNCLFVATTHYPEVKEFVKKTSNLINAQMEFDKESLKPMYKMKIGEAGESCALYIAQRLGFPAHMLERAEIEAYKNTKTNFLCGNSKAKDVIANFNKIEKQTPKKEIKIISDKFGIGDSVKIYPQKSNGIIFKVADEKGAFGVQIQGKKIFVNHKRLKLISKASEMYPDDYDFSIVFDSVENRKAKHQMSRKYNANIEIDYDKGELN